MAKTVNQRNVPDTPVNRKFNSTDAVMKMALHTIKICSNERVFTPQFADVTKQIEQTAINAYIAANDANNIMVKKGTRNYAENCATRLKLEELSITYCSRLLGYITIAQRLFHLRGKKVKYWVKLATDARSYIHAWNEAEVERFKN